MGSGVLSECNGFKCVACRAKTWPSGVSNSTKNDEFLSFSTIIPVFGYVLVSLSYIRTGDPIVNWVCAGKCFDASFCFRMSDNNCFCNNCRVDDGI